MTLRGLFAVAAAVLLGAGPAAATSRTYTLTVRAAPSVTVTSVPRGIACPPTCKATFAAGTLVRLEYRRFGAVPSRPRWHGCRAAGRTACTVRLTSDATVGASFAPLRPPARPPSFGGGDGSGGGGGRSVLDDIDAILDGLQLGSAAFNAPEKLRLGESTVVQLLVSGGRSVDDLRDDLTEVGERDGAEVRLGERMEARLTGFGFRIEAITPERQPVGRASTTEWRWQVEAAEAGRRRLHLTLSALVDIDGERTPHSVRTFDRTLEVEVTWTRRVGDFVGGNWQWLWSTFLIPIGAWVWRSRRRPSPA